MFRTARGTTVHGIRLAAGGLVLATVSNHSLARAESEPDSRAQRLQKPSGLTARSLIGLPRVVEASVRQDFEGWANPSGGFERATAYTGALSLGAKVDLSAWVAGLSSGIQGLWLQGSSLSSRGVGDAGGVSNVAGLPTLRLFQFWFEWSPFDSHWGVKGGQLAIDDDFMVLPTAQLFGNSGFGTPQTFALNVPAPIYPLGALGVRVRYRPDDRWKVLLGLYDLDAGAESTSRHFADYRLSAAQGVLALAEVSWLPGAGSQLSVGGFHALAPERELGDTGETTRRMSQLYAMMEQVVTQVRGSRVHVFAHAAVAFPSRRAVAGHQLDAGVVVSGELWGRPEDDLGAGLIRVGFGRTYLNDARSVAELLAPTEWVGELTYALRYRSWAQAAPTLQWVGDPHFSRRDSVVVGLRLSLEH